MIMELILQPRVGLAIANYLPEAHSGPIFVEKASRWLWLGRCQASFDVGVLIMWPLQAVRSGSAWRVS